MIRRRETRQVRVGQLTLGGNAPVRIQSMTNTFTRDVAATVAQIDQLTGAGCEIVRVACAVEEDARALGKIKARIQVPLVADIHFSHRFALIALEEGVDKLRINPGNIGSRDRIEEVVLKAKERKIPIRIGINSGSLEKDLMEKYGPTPEAMVESAKRQIRILEDMGFSDTVISLKSSDVPAMIQAYRLASQTFDYPLHLGVTEAGTLLRGSVYSAVGLGTLLQEGIGDTLRVSLTADPVEEVKVAKMILEALELKECVRVISCPTCGRAEIDVVKLAREVEDRAMKLKGPLTISVMGCSVNGPGEAHRSDFGITGGKDKGMIYIDGKQLRVVDEKDLVDELFKEIEKRRELSGAAGKFDIP
ncbi:MAG: flavodoxin-dependent (E)-4-hydroxy-3-methylbut-2-enyl-diphosphate synthase [Candidatus Omnitrophica bacterium]|nr:flavodoxin-dependent (E)-4-hydroxy-3-methylbut-2-enyl-diphosphate synthase [Candidatus Omnitrophota bacterium]MDD5671764.1 flavodoxin-dependent (E)-4-hydroxy-3-methylbut-2-enyl-diphosphate synthase [Candidatus Omnitrophota bacterium]